MIKSVLFVVLLGYMACWASPVPGTLPPDFVQATKPLRDGCISKSGSSEAAIEKFISGPIPAAEDAKLRSYMSCIFTDLQIVDPKGNLMLEKLLVQLPDSIKEVALAMAKPCMDIQGKTLDDKVWWLHQCWKRSDPVHYFMV